MVPGSLVFTGSHGPVDLSDIHNWWSWIPGAQWRHPEGPGSTLHGRERHPVTHIAHQDAETYAAWAGKELPTEAEWEYAARGGLEGKTFTWGDEFAPKGKMMANTWQGEFPWQNTLLDRYERTSPVKCYPPNGYGLYDMAGNVWEWTDDFFTPVHPGRNRPAVLHAPQPSHDLTRSQLQPRRAWRAHTATGHQRRLPPLRTQLLPPLQTRGQTRRTHRQHNQPHRLPLHRATLTPPPTDLLRTGRCRVPGITTRAVRHGWGSSSSARRAPRRGARPPGTRSR